jgi:hypothetical protein
MWRFAEKRSGGDCRLKEVGLSIALSFPVNCLAVKNSAWRLPELCKQPFNYLADEPTGKFRFKIRQRNLKTV